MSVVYSKHCLSLDLVEYGKSVASSGGVAMSFEEQVKFLGCPFSKGTHVRFPTEVRINRKSKLREKVE